MSNLQKKTTGPVRVGSPFKELNETYAFLLSFFIFSNALSFRFHSFLPFFPRLFCVFHLCTKAKSFFSTGAILRYTCSSFVCRVEMYPIAAPRKRKMTQKGLFVASSARVPRNGLRFSRAADQTTSSFTGFPKLCLQPVGNSKPTNKTVTVDYFLVD